METGSESFFFHAPDLLHRPQLAHILCGERRRLRTEAGRDVVGDRRDLPVVVGSSERRHGYRAVLGWLDRAGQDHQRDVGRTRVVHGAAAGQRGARREQAFAGPAVATGAGAFVGFLAVRVDASFLACGDVRRVQHAKRQLQGEAAGDWLARPQILQRACKSEPPIPGAKLLAIIASRFRMHGNLSSAQTAGVNEYGPDKTR